MRYYAGIGSRDTPEYIRIHMCNIGRELAELGFALRSGAAPGADESFEAGANLANGPCEIFLPWINFNGHTSTLYTQLVPAKKLARQYHPAWHRCSPAAKKLHARNVHQILGLNLRRPADFVLCWTDGGKGRGGTGMALRIAEAYNVPIHDFGSGDLNWKYLLNGRV